MDPSEPMYDVAIVGGGASGAALLYVLSRYTSLPRFALIEKYRELGSVNSAPENNSQTLHVGDIETNYSIEKAREVYSAAMMVARYAEQLPDPERSLLSPMQKMVLGIGEAEVQALEERFVKLKEFMPGIELLDRERIAALEPKLVDGRDPRQAIAAIKADGFAVDFGALARSLARHADGSRSTLFLDTEIVRVRREHGSYMLVTEDRVIRARVVVFDTDAYSLGFAKQLGLGGEYSLIPIAGTFYFTPEVLRGKVYRVQDPRMPFAAIHGDPDLTRAGATRWGPTARLYPALEARRLFSTAFPFFRASGFHRIATWISFASILLDPVRFWYLVRNIFYEIPYFGKLALLPHLRAIVPSIRVRDISRANGYGGMRLQRVDTRSRQLLLGEGKIVGDNIVFNMSPSPGASVCLYNAMRDAELIAKFLPEYAFDKERMLDELCMTRVEGDDVSQKETYPS